MLSRFLLLAALVVPPVSVHALDSPPSFANCLTKLQQEAIAEGINATTVNAVLADAKPLERVLASDRAQPEFVQTFPEYFALRVNEQRISQGRTLLITHQALLARIQRKTGIPPHYLLALWGLETNFGNYFGKLSIPSALTTLACDSRRARFFKGELFATLRIIAAGDMAKEELIGSWAGAIGHMQFMPSTYLEFAIDGNDDGKRNLMNTEDALTSGANYLNKLGWQSGVRWGREVLLPEDFDYAQTGSDQWRSLNQWRKLGVMDAFGKPLPVAELDAAVVLPAGYTGPAFLVYPNYKRILDWNRSHFYALSVGRLADRIAGVAPLQRTLPSVTSIALSSKRVHDLQARLNELGFPAGKPDGVIGSGTSRAVRLAQQKFGLRADGYPNEALFAALFTSE